MRNQDVVSAWKNNQSAKTKHLTSTGRDLYSYALRIGTTYQGEKYILAHALTQTTKKHLRLAQSFAIRINSLEERL